MFRKKGKNVDAGEKRTANLDSGLEVLVTIINRNKADFYTDLIQSFDVNMQLVTMAEGTADARTLSLLGIADTDKAVIFSMIREDMVPKALTAIEEKFETIKDGKGIAFTFPMTSIIGVSIFGFLADNRKTVKESN